MNSKGAGMKRQAQPITSFRLLAGLALTLTVAGCAGVSGGAVPAALLMLVGLTVSLVGFGSPVRALTPIACEGTIGSICQNGELVDACCPRGAICNFGRGLEICDDGSCAQYPDRCAQEEPTPTPTPVPSVCAGDCDQSGRVTVDELVRCVSILLHGSSLDTCSAVDADADGGVVVSEAVRAVANAMNGCAPTKCTGYWDQACRDGVLVDVCCPPGVICNFGQGVSVCDDGSCVNSPDTCTETCDGRWEVACHKGALVPACCPPKVVCNFGLGLEICDDGSCVYRPDSCP